MADMNSSSAATRGREERTGSTSAAHGREGNGDSASGGFMGKVRERANAQLSTQKDRAIEGIDTAARAVRQSTQQLREEDHGTVASYVEGAADQIERLSQRLREKDVGELLEDVQRLARRQPALFVGSAFALGLIGARFLKSSREDEYEHGEAPSRQRAYAAQRARPAGGWRTGMDRRPGYGTAAGPRTGTAGTSGIGAGTTGSAATGDTSGRSGTGGTSGATGPMSGSTPAARTTEGYTTPGTSRGRRGGADSGTERE
jgi:hypothetical protein